MVAKCANPTCNRIFRQLSMGRLFLLPPNHNDPESMSTWKFERLSDYCFWLCPECEPTLTITRCESEVVVSERGPGTTYCEATASHRRPQQIRQRSYTQAA